MPAAISLAPQGRTRRGATAMARSGLSKPVMLALDDGLLGSRESFFDYGCGRGGDVTRLQSLGYEAAGWDPIHRPQADRGPADVVNLGYVVNVIEDPRERRETLTRAFELARKVLVVAARGEWEGADLRGHPHADGVMTSKGTFQKLYSQDELRGWIESSLGKRPIAAAPGVFYAFRDDIAAQGFLANKIRRRSLTAWRGRVERALVDASRDELQPIAEFVKTRGRLPEQFEATRGWPEILERFGGYKPAMKLARHLVDERAWLEAREQATTNLTVYLAIAALGGRPRFTGLPEDLQVDVRTFFGSYPSACETADKMLFTLGQQSEIDGACRTAPVGKLTPEALYVHTSALPTLPPLLSIYEACARVLTGDVEGATIIKLHRFEPKVSYLAYPGFDSDPHPPLVASVRADLRRLDVKYRDFSRFENPPILHRKELFVPIWYPGREKFARLTRAEERAGLYADVRTLGTQAAWSQALARNGHIVVGHTLRRASTILPEASPIS